MLQSLDCTTYAALAWRHPMTGPWFFRSRLRARFATTAALLFPLLAIQPNAASGANVISASGAQSLLIDPSVRAGGMGRASSAVFWGIEPNAWSNPALLPYNQGVRYEWGRTQLVPELADDVYFTSKRLTAAYAGIGIQIAGKPIDGLGNMRLDYGETVATDPDGNPVATFTSFENIESFGAAVSGLEFSEYALRALGMTVPPLSRFGDVSVGWSEKETRVFLAPALVTLDGLSADSRVTTHDSGVLFRLTPYNSIDYTGWIAGLDRFASLRLDLSYARSTLNYDDATIAFIDEDQKDPILRTHRTGWGVHAAVGLSPLTRRALERRGMGWLPNWISPVVQWGKAWDREVPMILDAATDAHVTGSTIKDEGWELTFLNIYSIRRGRMEDPEGLVIGNTSGWSLGLQFKDIAGFSYDEATVPQSLFLRPVHRKAATFFVNPIRLWSVLRNRQPRQGRA